MFDHRVVGDDVTVIKSPYYYDQGAVHLDKIVFKPIPDAARGGRGAQGGRHPGARLGLADRAAERPGRRSSLRVIQHERLGWRGIVINIGNKNGAGNPPYANVGTPLASSPELRQAFEEAIDRNAMNRVVFGGTDATRLHAGSRRRARRSTPSIHCTPYNPADARKLVAASGLSNPTVHLLVANTTDALRLAQFIQAQEAAVGINVVIDSFDAATVTRPDGERELRHDARRPGGGADTDRSIYQYFATSGHTNFSGYSNPRLDLILANSRKATSARGADDALPLGPADPRQRPPGHLPLPPDRFAGVQQRRDGCAAFSADLVLRSRSRSTSEMTSRARITVMLFAGAALALGVLGPASARTQAPGEVRRHARRRHQRLPRHTRPDAQPGACRRSWSTTPSASSSTTSTPGRASSRSSPPRCRSISKDKLTYTIPLRQGIEFNDGTPFNAQAVVTTLQRMISLPGSIPHRRALLGRERHRLRAVHGRDPPERRSSRR